MLKRIVSAIRRATGMHPRRRWDDFDGASCAADVINRSMLEIATRTHGPDIISRMRTAAEQRRRHSDEPQLHLFTQEDNP